MLPVESTDFSNSGTRSSASEKRKVSESTINGSVASRYWGNPLSVLRLIEPKLKFQPMPKIPFPDPEL